MAEGLIETAAQPVETTMNRIYGVTVAQVIENIDTTGQARVQVRLPWLPGVEPWARLAVADRGMYFVPQVGDEVLVAFNHGDVREPYVIGCLWNSQDRPPAPLPTDAVDKRIIWTPGNHRLEFDDLSKTITITSATEQTITIDPLKIEIAAGEGGAAITLDKTGNVSIKATLGLELKGTTIRLQGEAIDINGSAVVNVKGGPACNIEAGLVKIN